MEDVGKVTSDESSGVEKSLSAQVSPRKVKKGRDNVRRKSSPRSPNGGRGSRRRNGSNEDKPSSLPGSLPRRRSSTQMKSLDTAETTYSSNNTRLR